MWLRENKAQKNSAGERDTSSPERKSRVLKPLDYNDCGESGQSSVYTVDRITICADNVQIKQTTVQHNRWHPSH